MVRGHLRQSTKPWRRLERPCLDAGWPGPFPATFSGAKVPWEFQANRPDTDHFNRDFKPEAARGGVQICRLNPSTGQTTPLTRKPRACGTSAPALRTMVGRSHSVARKLARQSARTLGDGHRWTARTLAHARHRRPGGRPSALVARRVRPGIVKRQRSCCCLYSHLTQPSVTLKHHDTLKPEIGVEIGVGPEQCVAAKRFARFVIDTEPRYSRFSGPFSGSKESISISLR